MTRNVASALGFGATVAAAALAATATIVSGNVHADIIANGEISVDNTPFVSTRTRSEVKGELMGQADLVRTGASEWAMQHDQASAFKSAYTREQAKAEYKAARSEVMALTAEDGGALYFKRPAMRGNTTVMGAPAR
jgi:hypothetical protein